MRRFRSRPDSPVDVARRLFEAIAERDADAAVDLVADDFELHTSAFITGQRRFVGKEGMREWFRKVEELRTRGENLRMRPRRYVGDAVDEELVLVLANVTIDRQDAGQISSESAYLFRVVDGLLVSADGFLDGVDGLAKLAEPVELG